jgi:hypothetical protein
VGVAAEAPRIGAEPPVGKRVERAGAGGVEVAAAGGRRVAGSEGAESLPLLAERITLPVAVSRAKISPLANTGVVPPPPLEPAL